MKEKLLNLLNNSYSPYSNFKVACIVVTKDNKEFIGVNVENSSYGATICAERSAILSAISNGYKKHDFEKLYVMCDSLKISKRLGTRHRAALGISEEMDSISIIVSEETGRVSLAIGGELYYNMSIDEVKMRLLDELKPKSTLTLQEGENLDEEEK